MVVIITTLQLCSLILFLEYMTKTFLTILMMIVLLMTSQWLDNMGDKAHLDTIHALFQGSFRLKMGRVKIYEMLIISHHDP